VAFHLVYDGLLEFTNGAMIFLGFVM